MLSPGKVFCMGLLRLAFAPGEAMEVEAVIQKQTSDILEETEMLGAAIPCTRRNISELSVIILLASQSS